MWNSPIDFTYAFTGVDGWPMLLLTVLETDSLERQDLGGYGVVRLPCSPGEHTRFVPISRPRGSWWDSFTAFFVGGRPRYDHPFVLTTPHSRYGHETVSMGMAEIKISVAIQGMETPAMQHVSFDVDTSQAAQERASVCVACPKSSDSGGGGGSSGSGARRDDDDDAEDAEDRTENPDQQALLRKEQ
jgi:hypothetical protein